jgi:hypothetical protein
MIQGDQALRYRIESAGEGLLKRAEKTVKSVVCKDLKDLKVDQVRGLLRQAQTGCGVEHMCNWLRYQRARVKGWKESGLAEVVLSDLVALKEDARIITETLYPGQAGDYLGVVWLALARRYAAYLDRWYCIEIGRCKQEEANE